MPKRIPPTPRPQTAQPIVQPVTVNLATGYQVPMALANADSQISNAGMAGPASDGATGPTNRLRQVKTGTNVGAMQVLTEIDRAATQNKQNMAAGPGTWAESRQRMMMRATARPGLADVLGVGRLAGRLGDESTSSPAGRTMATARNAPVARATTRVGAGLIRQTITAAAVIMVGVVLGGQQVLQAVGLQLAGRERAGRAATAIMVRRSAVTAADSGVLRSAAVTVRTKGMVVRQG